MNLTVVNVYKPTENQWPIPPLFQYSHAAIITGGFNSHHTDWGYDQGSGAVHERGSSSGAHGFYDCGSGSGALFYHGSSFDFCSFSHIKIFNWLGVPQVE